MDMSLFERFKRPEVGTLSQDEIDKVIQFTESAFGCSEWVTRGGADRPYYFNLDKAFSTSDSASMRVFFDLLGNRIRQVIEAPHFQALLGDEEPVIGYICPHEAPTGIVQARGSLAERLEWRSILVYPDKKVLRSRVIPGGEEKDFPDSVRWLKGRQVLLLSDATTTGESLARSKGTLRTFGCRILAAVTVFDRDEGAGESLERIRVPLYPVYTARDLERVLVKKVDHKTCDANDVDLLEKVRAVNQSKTIRDYSHTVSMAS